MLMDSEEEKKIPDTGKELKADKTHTKLVYCQRKAKYQKYPETKEKNRAKFQPSLCCDTAFMCIPTYMQAHAPLHPRAHRLINY